MNICHEFISIGRHFKARDVFNPMFGPGDGVLFMCDISGTQALWKVSKPMTWPCQLTFTAGDVLWSTWSPTEDEIAFGMDQTGTDQPQLYLFDTEDRTVKRITDEPTVAHRWGGWSSDGSRFAYAANQRRKATFDVYVQDRDVLDEEPQLVSEHDQRSVIVPLEWGRTMTNYSS